MLFLLLCFVHNYYGKMQHFEEMSLQADQMIGLVGI